MLILRLLAVGCIAIVLFGVPAHAGSPKSETIVIKETGKAYELTVPVSRLTMTIPKGGLKPEKNDLGGGAGDAFKQEGSASFQVIVTPVWSGKSGRPLPNGEQLKQEVRKSADEARAQAVERTIEIKELKGEAVSGYYFSATDRAPKPGEFKYMTQGMLRTGKLMLIFTVLTNDGQTRIVDDALAMLKGARHVVSEGI